MMLERGFSMILGEIMSTNVTTVSPDTLARDAWQILEERKFHHLIVVEKDKVVGVISNRDLGGTHGADQLGDQKVRDLMTKGLISANVTTTFGEAAEIMAGHTIGCLPVVDGENNLVGVVTITDLLHLLGRLTRNVKPTQA